MSFFQKKSVKNSSKDFIKIKFNYFLKIEESKIVKNWSDLDLERLYQQLNLSDFREDLIGTYYDL